MSCQSLFFRTTLRTFRSWLAQLRDRKIWPLGFVAFPHCTPKFLHVVPPTGHALMASLGRLLRTVAAEHHIAILVSCG